MHSDIFDPNSARTLFGAISTYRGPDRRAVSRHRTESESHIPLWVVIPLVAAISIAGWALAAYVVALIARLG